MKLVQTELNNFLEGRLKDAGNLTPLGKGEVFFGRIEGRFKSGRVHNPESCGKFDNFFILPYAGNLRQPAGIAFRARVDLRQRLPAFRTAPDI